MFEKIIDMFKTDISGYETQIVRLKDALKQSQGQTAEAARKAKAQADNSSEILEGFQERLAASQNNERWLKAELDREKDLTSSIQLRYNDLRSRVSMALNLADEER